MKSNKEILKDYLDALWCNRNLNALDKYVDKYVQIQSPLGKVRTKEDMLKIIAQWFISFPDLSFEWNDFIAEDNKVVVHWTATGTQSGDFYDIKATHKKITWAGVAIYYFEHGKIVRYRAMVDMQHILDALKKD